MKRAAAPSTPVAADAPLALPAVVEMRASEDDGALLGSPGTTVQSQAVHFTDASRALIKDSISKSLRDGLRGLQSELAGLRKARDSLSTTLNILSTTVSHQGVGKERTAHASKELQGAGLGRFSGVLEHQSGAPSNADAAQAPYTPPSAPSTGASWESQGGKRWDELQLAKKHKIAARNQGTLCAVRDKCKETLVKAIFRTDVSADALPDVVETKQHVHVAVRAVLNVPEDRVQGYLDALVYFPSRQPGSEPVKARISAKLALVLPHLSQGFRRHLVPVYFKHLPLPLSDLNKDVSSLGLDEDKNTHSDAGTDAVTEALRSLYRRWGGGHRVLSRPSVGEHPHVNTTVGSYALVSLLVCNHLDDAVALSETGQEDSRGRLCTSNGKWS